MSDLSESDSAARLSDPSLAACGQITNGMHGKQDKDKQRRTHVSIGT